MIASTNMFILFLFIAERALLPEEKICDTMAKWERYQEGQSKVNANRKQHFFLFKVSDILIIKKKHFIWMLICVFLTACIFF